MAKKNIDKIKFSPLDLKSTLNTLQEGSMKQLKNLRYNGKELVSMYGYKVVSPINQYNSHIIIFRHNTTNGINFITFNNSSIQYIIVSGGVISIKQTLINNVTFNVNQVKVEGFGKFIFIHTNDISYYFSFENDTYINFDIDSLSPMDDVNITYQYKNSTDESQSRPSKIYEGVKDNSNGIVSLEENYHIQSYNEIHSAGYITGAVYLIFAYKLYDGSIVKNSKIYLVNSEKTSLESTGQIIGDYTYNADNTRLMVYQRITGCKPELEIKIGNNINKSLVKSIVVYSTRNNPIYNYSSIFERFSQSIGEQGKSTYYINGSKFFIEASDKLVTTPYYEICSIPIEDFNQTTNKYVLTLNYQDHYDNIEFNLLYEPTFSVHKTSFKQSIDYNAMLHTLNHTVKLYEGAKITPDVTSILVDDNIYIRALTPTGMKLLLYYHLNIDGDTKIVKREETPALFTHSSTGSQFNIILPNLISYQDFRAKKLEIFLLSDGNKYLIKSYSFIELPALNQSIFLNSTGNSLCGSTIIPLPTVTNLTPRETPIINDIYQMNNRIMVSKADNPFVFEPQHNYKIGDSSCEVLSICTSTNQMSEMTFGEYPVIAFTNQGVYALQQGNGDVLYDRVVLISTIRINSIKDNIVVDGTIFYLDTGRLYALINKNNVNISDILDDQTKINDNYTNFKEYSLNSNMYLDAINKEIIVHSESYNWAYVYSYGNNSWTTRDFSGRYIDSTTIASSIGIVSTLVEEDKNNILYPHFITRSLRFLDIGLKKVERLKLNYSSNDECSVCITLWGSNNHKTWYRVSSSDNGEALPRTYSSWRLYRVEVKAGGWSSSDKGFFFITDSFTVEYTNKYINSEVSDL